MRIDLLSLAILIIGSLLVGQASAESKDVGSASPVAQVTPLNVTLGESVVINYTVLDTHGSGLKQVELWRKEEDGTWQKIKQETLAGNTGPVSGSFTDSPLDPGIYWYGVHVVDNTGKWNDEQNANTAYQPGNWGPAEVAVVDPASPIVQAFKVTPLNVSFDATGMAENTSTKSNATMQLTVFTDSNSSATYVDIPPIGKSLGDTYYVNNNLHSENATGPIVGELFASTTVVKMSPSNISGPEQRYVFLDYTFNNKTDQIIVGSIADYPVEGYAFEMNRTIICPILGGSGKYFGVTGQVATTHKADGSYTHVFTMLTTSPVAQVTPLNVSFGATGMAENTSTKSNATMQLTVFTDSNSSASYVDIPPIGKSLGDTYYVNNNLHSENATGPIVGELFASTAVVKMSPSNISGPEQRYVFLDYTFNNKTDQIIVGSIADYPVEGHAFEMNRTIIRPILGGSGKYFGVTGQEAATHNADGSYTHVFTMLR